MTPEEIYKFAKEHPHCFLATLEKEQPRVRGIHIFRINENGLIFHTAKIKSLYSQLCNHKRGEFCFIDFQNPTQVRIAGTLEEIVDVQLKEEIVEEREYLKPLVAKGGLDGLAVFSMKKASAIWWSLQDIMGKPEPVKLF